MTVKELEELLATIEDKDMLVMIDTGDTGIISACIVNSEVVELPLLDGENIEDFFDIEDDDEQETIEVLLLVPCNHVHDDLEQGELNSQPELN